MDLFIGYCPICDKTKEFYIKQKIGRCDTCGHHLDLSKAPQEYIGVGSSVESPETLAYCRSHYCPPVQTYINCPAFGRPDGMDGSCWWCMEMTPYQWHMCADEFWVRNLLSPCARNRKDTRADAVKFIEQRKHESPIIK